MAVRITQKDIKFFSDIASRTANVLPFEKDTPAKQRKRIKKSD
jgi:hypothetical protein